MGDEEDGSDNRTFRVNFSEDGAANLGERIREKLKEFMGDYTDDTLVEYVVVLLRNGRYKHEAQNDLNVFLGDDTDNFVSWLWDHLSSNLHLYVQQQHHHSAAAESEKEKPLRRKRKSKGLVADVPQPPPLRTSEIQHVKQHSHSPPPPPPPPSIQIQIQNKRASLPHPTIGAPRRLLQFAVRDALGTLRPPSSATAGPTLKRLRSVVSKSLDDQPQRISSVARRSSAASIAAEDATKAIIPSNVFDPLGHGMDTSEMSNQSHGFQGTAAEDEYEDVGDAHSSYLERNEYSEFTGNTMLLDTDTRTAYDEVSVVRHRAMNDVYDDGDAIQNRFRDDVNDDANVTRHRVTDASDTGTSYGKKGDDDSLLPQYSVADNTNEIMRRTQVKEQNPPAAVANTSRKIVNISVNVNTWKPANYQAQREARQVESLGTVQESDAGTSRSGIRLKENNNLETLMNENEKAGVVMQKESQKTLPSASSSYTIGRPSEDADSRTIFVNNVHFAATKDTLSRHFNKFGEVLKVVILADAATGQPKGSAYIEFMRKEGAELALSLNGTSFMSRILKVVKKSSANQDTSGIMTWPHVARASPFAARFARTPLLRGMPVAFRTRLPIKPGARSLQWKRDAPTTSANEATVNVQNGTPLTTNVVRSPTARSLTYVRK